MIIVEILIGDHHFLFDYSIVIGILLTYALKKVGKMKIFVQEKRLVINQILSEIFGKTYRCAR